jgi:hypothetical protein
VDAIETTHGGTTGLLSLERLEDGDVSIAATVVGVLILIVGATLALIQRALGALKDARLRALDLVEVHLIVTAISTVTVHDDVIQRAANDRRLDQRLITTVAAAGVIVAVDQVEFGVIHVDLGVVKRVAEVHGDAHVIVRNQAVNDVRSGRTCVRAGLIVVVDVTAGGSVAGARNRNGDTLSNGVTTLTVVLEAALRLLNRDLLTWVEAVFHCRGSDPRQTQSENDH